MKNTARPDCYGELDKVFPMGEDMLRSVSEACQACPSVHNCLKAAINTPEGLEMRASRMEEYGEKAPSSGGGVAGFFKRWSELKSLRTAGGGSGRKKRKN